MRKVCINLDSRPDRWEMAQQQFDDIGWEVDRFPAIDLKPGWVGCAESHLRLIKLAYDDKEDILILEDDVQFLVDPVGTLEQIMGQLPEDWDMLYLGASPKEPQERYSDNLFRLKNAHVTHAILWHYRPKGAMEYVLNRQHKIEKIDDFFVEKVQPKFNCYVTFPMLATQWDNQSNIANRSDVSTIQRNYKLYCR
jgi:GR25 family glycosyltransferase involved in LPS biosynthesis